MTWLVAGLGNPGSGYADTRHNVGYLVTDVLADRLGGRWKAHKPSRTDVVEGRIGSEKVVLMRSRSYMNESGGPVNAVAAFFGIDADRLIVVHDELDIDFSMLRVKLGGGDNGHNGLKSVTSAIGTNEYFRVRVGIGRPPGQQNVHDFVLKRWSATERKELAVNVEEAADAVESLITRGLVATQAAFNR